MSEEDLQAEVERLRNEIKGLRDQEDFDPSPVITLYDQAVYRAEEEALAAAAWRDRCVAQDQLLICYRTGRNPSEKLHRELERTRLAIHALLHPELQP